MTAVVCRISSTSPTSLPNTCSTSESYSPARPRIYSRWDPVSVAQRNFAIFNKTVWYVPIHLRLRCGTVSWSRGNKNFKKYVPRFLGIFLFCLFRKKIFLPWYRITSSWSVQALYRILSLSGHFLAIFSPNARFRWNVLFYNFRFDIASLRNFYFEAIWHRSCHP